ncbi:MAG: hypothetical protein ICV55_13775 [Coleofasciculus sp. C3-bin4]|nr:hypothetical protein [Coleofasciculus sp. C3-bin4]
MSSQKKKYSFDNQPARSQNDTATWKALLAGVDTIDAIAQPMHLKIRES